MSLSVCVRLFLFCVFGFFFFFNDTATTEIYTLSLHDALPICTGCAGRRRSPLHCRGNCGGLWPDRKSTRLNSSHLGISYAVFFLKKKRKEGCTRDWRGARRTGPPSDGLWTDG